MASLAELSRQHTALARDQVHHLQRLVAEWGMVADLCFADLLLFAPVAKVDGRGQRFVVVGQIRPTTSRTLHHADWVGQFVAEVERPDVAAAWRDGVIAEADLAAGATSDRVRVEAIPVRCDGVVVAVVTREWSPAIGRTPGELERTYLQAFGRLAAMIADGTFPYAQDATSADALPRVGDGVFLFDAGGRVEYASPNAVSALHRVGIGANAVGQRLDELGFDDTAVVAAFERGAPVTEEVESGPEVTLLLRCLPFLCAGRVVGALGLVRDVSEVRRRDRMLLTKDATIREIHHRVKNNLQTISSLLRLQGRRLASPEAKVAIEESVRRIRTIALVHETLSREPGDDVAFVEILRPLARMVEEGLGVPERPVRIRVVGDGGHLPATVATPLAVVLTELLQNCVEHAFTDGGGHAVVVLEAGADGLRVRVVDDGSGLPEGFSLDAPGGLGLSIVRTLVTHELGGRILLRPATLDDLASAGLDPAGARGTVAEVSAPRRPPRLLAR